MLHSRKFWGVIIATQLLISMVTFLSLITNSSSITEVVKVLLSISGGTTFGVITDLFVDSENAEFLAMILFVIFYLFFLNKTFKKNFVEIMYPFILSINWAISYSILFLFYSSI